MSMGGYAWYAPRSYAIKVRAILPRKRPARHPFFRLLKHSIPILLQRKKRTQYCRSLSLLFGRLAEGPLHHVVRVGRYRSIAPQPPHHLGHDRPAELLTVQVHAPGVVHVVTLLRKGLHQPHVLVEPVALLVVNAVADAAVVAP